MLEGSAEGARPPAGGKRFMFERSKRREARTVVVRFVICGLRCEGTKLRAAMIPRCTSVVTHRWSCIRRHIASSGIAPPAGVSRANDGFATEQRFRRYGRAPGRVPFRPRARPHATLTNYRRTTRHPGTHTCATRARTRTHPYTRTREQPNRRHTQAHTHTHVSTHSHERTHVRPHWGRGIGPHLSLITN